MRHFPSSDGRLTALLVHHHSMTSITQEPTFHPILHEVASGSHQPGCTVFRWFEVHGFIQKGQGLFNMAGEIEAAAKGGQCIGRAGIELYRLVRRIEKVVEFSPVVLNLGKRLVRESVLGIVGDHPLCSTYRQARDTAGSLCRIGCTRIPMFRYVVMSPVGWLRAFAS